MSRVRFWPSFLGEQTTRVQRWHRLPTWFSYDHINPFQEPDEEDERVIADIIAGAYADGRGGNVYGDEFLELATTPQQRFPRTDQEWRRLMGMTPEEYGRRFGAMARPKPPPPPPPPPDKPKRKRQKKDKPFIYKKQVETIDEIIARTAQYNLRGGEDEAR